MTIGITNRNRPQKHNFSVHNLEQENDLTSSVLSHSFGFQAGYSSPTQSAIREELSLSLAEVC